MRCTDVRPTLRHWLWLGALGLAGFSVALGACEADEDDYLRGDPTNAVVTLDDTHTGWDQSDCSGCHSPVHSAAYTVDQCSICHGGNGGEVQPATHDTPQLTEDHAGWLQADCGTCHSATGTHLGAYVIPACGVCHGSNGGPLRPNNHWLTHCNDCHATGPEAWNDCTHTGYELDAPQSCRYCHQ